MNIPPSNARPFLLVLGGGMDTETPVLQRAPGNVASSQNYEPKVGGGYARLGGIERFDGRPSPSSATITVLGAQGAFGAMAPGDVVTNLTATATGTVVYATESVVAMVRVTGTFASGDALFVSGAAKGIALTDPQVLALDANEMLAAAEDLFRADIGPVPGINAVRGLAVLNGEVYAWRDHDVSSQKVFKATGTGWQEVPMLQRVAFTSGTLAYTDGSTLTQGPVTATVERVIVQAGDPDDWPGTPTSGWLVLSGASGSFAAGAATGTGACTLSGAQSLITLSPGGRWELKPYNFFGGAGKRLYGVDGVNDLIEFDGEILAPIPVSMPLKPTAIELHKQSVWAAFGTSIQRSGIQDPYLWSVLAGAAEIAMGDTVTGLKSVAGSETEATLLVTSKDKSAAIYGEGSGIRLGTLSTEVGALAYTIQEVGNVIALDTAGMRDFTPSQAFGNFQSVTLTNHIRRKARNLTAKASVISRETGRYRLFLEGGAMLTGAPGQRWAWMFSALPWEVNVAAEGEIDGLTRVFIGCDDGYVREMDRGRSLDGEAMSYWIKTSPTNMGMQGVRKKISASCSIEVSAQSAGELRMHLEPDYGYHENLEIASDTEPLPQPPTSWDVDAWDTGYWDGQSGQTVRMRVRAAGETFSLTVFGESRTELPHELHSANLMHSVLRMVR